jgi:hypothetical protein
MHLDWSETWPSDTPQVIDDICHDDMISCRWKLRAFFEDESQGSISHPMRVLLYDSECDRHYEHKSGNLKGYLQLWQILEASLQLAGFILDEPKTQVKRYKPSKQSRLMTFRCRLVATSLIPMTRYT